MIKHIYRVGALLTFVVSSYCAASEHGFFVQETLSANGEGAENSARVTTSRELPQRTWDQACRSALLMPFRTQQVRQLESQLDTQLEGRGLFVSATIEGYRSYREADWLYCSATDIDVNQPESLAGTALREVWNGREHYDREVVVGLIQVALAAPSTYDDAVALIATTTDAENQLQFLDANLDPTQLKLPVAFASVFQVWLAHARFNEVIQYGQGCDTVECRRLIAQANQLKEQQDAEKVYDLSSYF